MAVSPCDQKSDANVYSAPSSRFHAWRAAAASHETKTISVAYRTEKLRAELGFPGADILDEPASRALWAAVRAARSKP